MKTKGIKKATSESKQYNAWAIVYNTYLNTCECYELVSNSDCVKLKADEIILLKSNAWRKQTTMREIKNAILDASHKYNFDPYREKPSNIRLIRAFNDGAHSKMYFHFSGGTTALRLVDGADAARANKEGQLCYDEMWEKYHGPQHLGYVSGTLLGERAFERLTAGNPLPDDEY